MAGIALILAIAGPFGTGALMPFVPRLIYWAALVGLTYGAGALIGPPLEARLERRPDWLRHVVIGSAIGLAASAIVLLLNLALFRFWPAPGELVETIAVIVPIGVVVTFLLGLLERHGAAPETRPAPPPLLDRLPLDKRGTLVALSVEDHYTRVRTTRGEELVLMRLGDAMRETGATPGGQVHRSHWVAWEAVRAARRQGDRAILTMSHGDDIPVSRTHIPTIRDAGLLPG